MSHVKEITLLEYVIAYLQEEQGKELEESEPERLDNNLDWIKDLVK